MDFDGNPQGAPVLASSTVPISSANAGRETVIVFEDADPRRPIVLGLIHAPALSPEQLSPPIDISADGKRVVISAERELVLRCGHASITLTQAGKVLIRGAYVSSRSSGVNRMNGGSVQIN